MRRIEHFGGKTLRTEDLQRVEGETGLKVPPPLASLLTSQPLVGLIFLLDHHADESELGAELRWMTADEMIDEATAAYPGIVAVTHGLLPVGICLEGTGDPYFLSLDDGAVVRVPHDAARDNGLEMSQVERVSVSIEHLVEVAKISGTTVDDVST